MTSVPLYSPNRDNILTLGKVLIIAFFIVGMSLFFWGIVRDEFLLARDDNPRRLEQELRVQRGSLTDRAGFVLATNDGPPDRQQRRYPFPSGGHVVGFYSIQHGTSGAEAGFDHYLRGESEGYWNMLWRQTLHLPQVGQDVQLALDHTLQSSAEKALGDNVGAGLLLEIPHNNEHRAWVRALSSVPGYDPAQLDETFEALSASSNAPLLNRVTQGQYQPGMLLQPLILAMSVEQGIVQLSDVVPEPDRFVSVNGSEFQCASPPPDHASWAEVLYHRCPGPMFDLADSIGVGGIDSIYSSFGLDRDPELEIDTETTPDQPVLDPSLAGIGQENQSVTPLQIGLAMAAIAGSGSLPQPQVGSAVQSEDGAWQPWRLDGFRPHIISASTARAIRESLPETDGIFEFSSVVLSGPAGSTNSWYVGLWHGPSSNYVAVVVLENQDQEEQAAAAGRTLLEMARR